MAERELNIRITAIDASGTAFRAAGQSIDTFAIKAERAAKSGSGLIGGAGFDPFKLALRPKFTGDEAEIRNRMADYIRGMRAEAQKSKIGDEVSKRLFGGVTEEAKKSGEEAGNTFADIATATSAKAFVGSARFAKALIKGGIIGFVGHELKQATEKIKELQEQFHKGEIGAGGIVEELAKGLPIIGGFVAAGRNIREMLDGSAEATRRIVEDTKRVNDLLDLQAAKRKREKADKKELEDVLRKGIGERALFGLKDPALSIEQERQALAERRIAIEEEIEAKTKEITEEHKKQAVLLKAAREAAQIPFNEARDALEAAIAARNRNMSGGVSGPPISPEQLAAFRLASKAAEQTLNERNKAELDATKDLEDAKFGLVVDANTKMEDAKKTSTDRLKETATLFASDFIAMARSVYREPIINPMTIAEVVDGLAKMKKSAVDFATDFIANAARITREALEARTEGEQTVFDSRIASLRAAGKTVLAEQEQIKRDIAAERAKLQSVIDDARMSAEEREAARREQGGLSERERKLLRGAGASSGRPQNAPLENARFLTGVGSATPDPLVQRIAKATEDQKVEQKKQTTILQRIQTLFERGGGNIIIDASRP